MITSRSDCATADIRLARSVPETHLIVAGLTAGDRAEAQALRQTIMHVLRRSTLRRTFAPDRVIVLQQAATAALKPKETD